MLRVIVLLLSLLALTPLAAADGKVFAFGFPDQSQAQIPDQQALICFKDGVETLAIETRFTGKGTDFGWVVPFPSQPEIAPATRGLFPTLRAVFQPRVRTTGYGLTLPLIFAAAGLLAVLHLRDRVWRIVGGVLIFAFGTCFMLPNLGTARGLAGDSAAIQFLDRRIVGDYDVTTLASSDGAALTAWLRENRFECSSAAAGVIADYAKQGWVFAAIKLRREADSAEPTTPHPLVFTFRTTTPIYPMRLSGADADRPLSLELFVFGEQRAAAEGLEAVSAAHAEFVEPSANWFPRANTEQLRISHAVLTQLVSPATFGTRLSGTFTPEQMRRDLQLRWEPSSPTGRLVYSDAAAVQIAWEIGLGVLCLGVVASRFVGTVGSNRRSGAILAALFLPILFGGVVYAAIPTVQLAPRSAVMHSPARALGEYLAGLSPESLEQARTMAAEAAGKVVEFGITPREEDPKSPCEEDSPGNYTLRVNQGVIEYVWYDMAGQEHPFVLATNSQMPP